MAASPRAWTPIVAALCLVPLLGGSLFAAQPAASPSAPTSVAAPAAPAPTLPLTVEWIKSMGPDPGNFMPPLVIGDRLFVTHDGALYCLDLLTGGQNWKISVKDANVSTAPVAFKDTIIIGVDNGLLLAVSPKDGATVWKTDCGGYVAPTPAIIDGLLVAAGERAVLCLDPANKGRTKWVSMLTSGALYGPLSDGGVLYFRCLDGSVQSLDLADGHFRWRASAPTGPESYPPLMVDRHILLAEGSWLYAISRTGMTSWSQELPAGIGGPVTLQDNKLYVPCVNGRLYVLNPSSGRLQQRGADYQVEGSVTASPVVTDKLVFVGTSDALIYALDRTSGEVRWVYRCRAPEQPVDEASVFGMYAPLLQVNGNLIALSGTGDLYCFSSHAPDAAGPTFASLKPDPGIALPDATLAISFALFDDGIAVAPASVSATVDAQPVTLKFDPASGMGLAFFSKPADGIHLVKVTAQDSRGNQSVQEWSFLTDKSLVPKEAAPTTPRGGPQPPGANQTPRGRGPNRPAWLGGG